MSNDKRTKFFTYVDRFFGPADRLFATPAEVLARPMRSHLLFVAWVAAILLMNVYLPVTIRNLLWWLSVAVLIVWILRFWWAKWKRAEEQRAAA